MASMRTFDIFRYDPAQGGEGRFQSYQLEIPDQKLTTVLDALLRLQKEQDQTLAFRYACRIYMCGSCGLVINGREGLACKTIVGDLPPGRITLRPLNHFPVVKDLVVDMDGFFRKYEEALTFFDPAEERTEPAVIRPDSSERRAIDMATECIACGCCVSSCTMFHWHQDYLGPAALNRAFTLIADSRDGLRDERLLKTLETCYSCRLEFNCTEVCPKEISPTRAIKYIHRLAVAAGSRSSKPPAAPEPPAIEVPPPDPEMTRRRFLSQATLALGGIVGLTVAGVAAGSALAPSLRSRSRQWVKVGPLAELAAGGEAVKTVNIKYQVIDGFYKTEMTRPILVSRVAKSGEPVAFNSACTHLGCTVRWDEGKKLFLCACHGGAYNPDGTVKAGPPPRPLERYRTQVKDGSLYILEA